MPNLKDVHDKIEEIPEPFRELYTEKNGKFELTGIAGVKTSADVARINVSLEKERNEHAATKAKLNAWGDLKHEDVVAKLDRFEELEAAASNKLDASKIEELANKRAEGMVKTRIAPLERQLKTLEKEKNELLDTNTKLSIKDKTRNREDVLRPLMVEAKILPEHHEDVLMYAERHLELTDDGKWIAKEGVNGITAGALPKDWLVELLEKRPGWLPGSTGGGARGSGGGIGFIGGPNPWSHEGWNMTAQGAYLKQHGQEKAEQAAKAAGTKLGGPRPPAKK